MPPRRYRSITVREDVYRELELFAKSKGCSVSDAIRLLLEYRDIYSKIEELVKSLEKSSASATSLTARDILNEEAETASVGGS